MVGQQSSLNNLWTSRLIWRISFALFVVVLSVNALFSVMSLSQFERDRLYDLRELGLYSIIPALKNNVFDQSTPPIDGRGASRLILITPLTGISYYNLAKEKLGEEGEDFNLMLSPDMHSVPDDYYDSDAGIYEVVYTHQELGVPHYIVAQLNARRIRAEMRKAVQLEIVIVVLLSLFVTLVLIIALSRWFLDPILYLYNRLTAATRDPENPPSPDTNTHDKTEIGRAIEAADVLMQNNAEGLKRIKAMAESEVNRLAYFDTLTGLPNRTNFIKKLNETVADAKDHFMDRYAVLAMNVDHFKDINDTMGHKIGDEVLKAFAKRLEESAPAHALVARLGADEFALMVPLNNDVDEAEQHARDIIDAFRAEAIHIMDEQFQVRCSVGIAISPEDGDAPEDVLKCADIALNRAKDEGRDRAKRYDGKYTEDIQKRFEILRDLRVAIEKEELELYYQPQIDLKTGKITGAEALIRWWKQGEANVGGHFISPVDFIPVAEQSGLILPMSDWILHKACETAKSWADAGLGDLSIAVNFSGQQFMEHDVVEKIKKTITQTGVKPHQLEVEVTESVFMEDTDHSIKMLKEIQSLGVPIAIDDFGTGYSSLSYLQRFPIDKLKIDRAFIRHLDEQHDNLVLTKTILALCKTMGLKVVAEGVERVEEEAVLVKEGCDIVQGFRYSAPIPDSKFRKFVQDYNGKLDYFDE